MADDLSRVSLRAERKALQKAKILQRESDRNIVRLVRLEVSHLEPGLAANRLAGWRGRCLLFPVGFINVPLLITKVRSALKKPETERTEAEAAVLLLHRETVDELCKRQIRTDELKRKQEEVRHRLFHGAG